MAPRLDPLATIFMAGFLALAPLAGCSSATEDGDQNDDSADKLTVDTSDPHARAQYDANVAFATNYRPRCSAQGTRPRVLVTGFGRFPGVPRNLSGQMAARMLPDKVHYNDVPFPPAGTVDDPASHFDAGQGTVTLPNAGEVDVCAMILPVFWDVAGALIVKELNTFAPDVIVMTGGQSIDTSIGKTLSIELGAVNDAMSLEDATGLVPLDAKSGHRIIFDSPASEERNGSLLSWLAIRDAAKQELARLAADPESPLRVVDVRLHKFPWDADAPNTYLCNSTTYITDYAMRHPHLPLKLLRASPKIAGKANDVTVSLERDDLAKSPRVFIHIPPQLTPDEAATIIRTVVDTQLTALHDPQKAPTVGSNALAD